MYKLVLGMMSVLVLPLVAHAQEVRFLECGALSFFAGACVAIELVHDTAPTPATQQAYPLFSRDTLAPDTPPLMMRLLEHPTQANAEAFLAWQRARQERITYVQHLLRTAPKPQPGPLP